MVRCVAVCFSGKEFLGITNFTSDTFFNTVRLGKALSNYTSVFSAVGKINAENVQTFSLLNEKVFSQKIY